MRLTLRTMLAYLDDILEPDDSEDIRKKIEESQFATDLVHRTRDCMRRLRLGAPPLENRGSALDSNMVAEYLDNTLSAERVPDFEKVCLESDIHLAEVAACHQILTLVLGEPAEVDPDSRERMYQIQAQADAPPVAAGADVQSPPVAAPPVPAAEQVVRRPKPEVPEYLREPRSRLWPVAATILIAALLTGGVLAVFGPAEFRRQVAGMFGNPEVPPGPDKPVEPAPEKPEDGKPNDQPDAPKEAGRNNSDPAALANETDFPAPQRDKTAAERGGPAEPADRTGLKLPRGGPDMPDENAPAAPEPGGEPLPDAVVGDPGATDARPEPAPGDLANTTPKPALPRGGDRPPAAAEPENPAEDEAAPGAGLGRYLSEQDALLRFDRKANTWRRLPAKAALAAGDRLLSLPLFRPTISLATGVTIQFAGPSLIELQPTDDHGVQGVVVEYGRMLLLTAGKAGNQVKLQFGPNLGGTLVFADPAAGMAIEAHGVLVPGNDPVESPAPLAADLYATSGEIRWVENGTEAALRAPGRRTLTRFPAAELSAGEFPKWVNSELKAVDKLAASALERDLAIDRPIGLSLKELAENRRAEVRSLAIRSSGYIGQFDPFVNALNDADQRNAWPAHIEALQDALARGPEAAAQVRAAFEKDRGNAAPDLYRMLWGYNAEQLKRGEAAKLVEYLNNDSLDFRVLSFWNLKEITKLSLYYRPEYPPAKRRPQILKWREKLKEGKIAPTSATAAAAPAKPPARPAAKPDAAKPDAAPEAEIEPLDQ